jgi:hypothetical protein
MRTFGATCAIQRDWRLQLVYAELGHAASALVYLVADRPRHIELDNRSALGTAPVYPASLPCRPRQRSSPSASHYTSKKTAPLYKPNFNLQALHIHIIIIIFILSGHGSIVVVLYVPDLCLGGRRAHTDRSIDIEPYRSCFKPLTGTTRRDLRARYAKTNPNTAAGIAQ